MSIKVFYLTTLLDFFPEKLGDISEEQGERFYQNLSTIKERFLRHCDTDMMSNYCWSTQRDCPETAHYKKSLKRLFSEMSE